MQVLMEEDLDMKPIEEEISDVEKTSQQLKKYYEKIIELLKYYTDLNEVYYPIVALWIIGTYCHKSFNTFPYLFLNAMRGSGKTRLLKLIASLSNNGDIQANISEAVLFRTATEGTILIDELESIGSKEKGVLRELLNAGYKKGISVKRMRKIKNKEGQEEMAVQSFELYTPVCMANIWGMDEVLADRCISLILEKSSKKEITKIIEDFEENLDIIELKKDLTNSSVVTCNVVTKKNINRGWNNYIKNKYSTNNYTKLHTTYTTYNNTTTPEEDEILKKIDETGIDGRHLELFFPLFTLASILGKEYFNKILQISKGLVNTRKGDEYAESKDVLLYSFIAYKMPITFHNSWVSITDLTNEFKKYVGNPEDEMDWLNSKWIGRSLKRLNLVVQRRRLTKGVEVVVNHTKATEKAIIFRSEDYWDGQERRKLIKDIDFTERRKKK